MSDHHDAAPGITGELLNLAQNGNADAQLLLGVLYHDGIGVDKDSTLAARWLRKAAEQGLADAQFLFGQVCNNLRGTAGNIPDAGIRFQKAAVNGHAYAQYSLGLMYLQGEGLKKDFDMAHYWMKKSAELGNQNAVTFLERNATTPQE